MAWSERADDAVARYRGGETRDLDQRQLTQLANAAWAAGLALLMNEAVADALVTVAAADRAGYLLAVEDVLESFEGRTDFLEDVPVADTVLVLQELARARDAAVDLPQSALLP
jgi:hypothetical protein